MELQLSLLVVVYVVNVFNFDQRRHVSHYFSYFAETVSVDHIDDLLAEEFNKLRTRLFSYLGVSGVNSVYFEAHLLDKFFGFGILNVSFNHSIFCLHQMHDSVL